MVVQSTQFASCPIFNTVQHDIERGPVVPPRADVSDSERATPSRLSSAHNALGRALTVPFNAARALQADVRARGAGGAVAGFVGGALMGVILDVGLITVGAMALRGEAPFQNVGHHDGRVILGASIPAAAVVGALLLGANNAAGGGPAGGAGLGALSGLLIGVGLVTCGALARRNDDPFQNIHRDVANGLIAAGTAGDVVLGAILGALIGLASGGGGAAAVPMKG